MFSQAQRKKVLKEKVEVSYNYCINSRDNNNGTANVSEFINVNYQV